MFGFRKGKRTRRLWETIGTQLRDLLAFQRWQSDGHVPDALKENNYVLGYHFMMCLNLYIEAVGGKTETEEQGFVLTNALAIALDMDAHEIGKRLMPLMANPDQDFNRGTEHANAAYEKITRGDVTAFEEFKSNLRGKY